MQSESYTTSHIKHQRNMLILMVLAPLLVMTLAVIALVSGNTRNEDTQAAVNPAPTTNYRPADGKVYSGVRAKDAKYNDFLNRTGQPSVALYHTFRVYPENFNYSYTLTNGIPGAVPMISWTLFNGSYCYSGGNPCRPGSTNGSIARGDIDQYIIDRAANIRSYNKPVFLRINWEMNGHWFAFSSYKSASCASGSACVKADNGVEQYKDVWRRAVIIMDGGTKAEINERLAAQGMPGLTTNITSLPATNNVTLVWNASQSGKSDALQYYPGDEFVDWVGVDWYSKGTEDPNNQQAVNTAFNSQQVVPQKIYDSFSGPNSPGKKPYLVGEWGMWGEDNPTWMTAFLNWTEARPQVKALVYFNEDSASLHELRHFPNAAAVYKQRLTSTRYIKSGTQVTTAISPTNPSPPSPNPPPSNPVPAPQPSPQTSSGASSNIKNESTPNNSNMNENINNQSINGSGQIIEDPTTDSIIAFSDDGESIILRSVVAQGGVSVPKPIFYTFATTTTLTLFGLGTYLAIMKLSIFAGIRHKWGL